MEEVGTKINQSPKPAGKVEQKEKPSVKIWQIAIAVVLVVGYLFWLGNKFLGPPPTINTAKTRSDEAITAKASAEAGPDGDLTKVNPADRDAFLKMLAGAPVDPKRVLINYWVKHH